jgi:Ca-activated chloride channel homolog
LGETVIDPGYTLSNRSTGAVVAAATLIFTAVGSATDRHTLSVNSRLVLVPVTVTDTKGKAISGLDLDHFKVTEDSEVREIVALTRQDGATGLGIVLDSSGSMRSTASEALAAARAIAATAGDDDETFLMTFGDRPDLKVPLTRDHSAISRGLRATRSHGGTALVDAIWQALREVRGSSHPRRALVVISDGGENASRHRLAELKRMAIEADSQIHSISIVAPYKKGDPPGRPWLLEELAELTGGLHFRIHDGSGLASAAEKLARAMKEMYVLAYRPGESGPGKWRKVRVSVTPPTPQRVRVTARSGYYSE